MTEFLSILIPLIIAHVIIDFYCQPLAWVNDKVRLGWQSPKLVLHVLLHSISAVVVMAFFTLDVWSLLILFVLVGVSHWAIDVMKVLLGSKVRYLVLDQVLHLFVLVLVAVHVSPITLDMLLVVIKGWVTPKSVLIVLAYLLILKPASIVISSILAKYSPIAREENAGLLSGGEFIGYLERLLILTFVIKGQFAVIGFILAAKSIFRFGDLNNAKHRDLTEYVLLGSLLSVTLTSFLGLLVSIK